MALGLFGRRCLTLFGCARRRDRRTAAHDSAGGGAFTGLAAHFTTAITSPTAAPTTTTTSAFCCLVSLDRNKKERENEASQWMNRVPRIRPITTRSIRRQLGMSFVATIVYRVGLATLLPTGRTWTRTVWMARRSNPSNDSRCLYSHVDTEGRIFVRYLVETVARSVRATPSSRVARAILERNPTKPPWTAEEESESSRIMDRFG